MKVIAATVVAFALASAAHAESSARPIPFIAAKGDTAKVVVTHRKADKSEYGEKAEEVTLTYRIEVDEEIDEGFRLTWHPISLKAKGQTLDTSKDLPEIEQDIPLKFETDGAGTPLALTNYEAVRDNSVRAVETASMRLGQKVVDSVRSMFSGLNATSAADVFGKYAQTISLFQGTALEPGQPNQYEAQVPSPFGQGLIKYTGALALTEVDTSTSVARMTWRQEADAASAKAVVMKLVIDASKRIGKEVDEEKLKATKLEINYVGSAVVGLKDGWVKSLRYEMTVFSDEAGERKTRAETYDITIER